MGSSAASPLPMPPPPLSTPLPLFAPPGFCPNPAAAAASATATATSATSRKRVYHQTAHSDRPLLKRVSTPLPHWSRPPSPSPSLPLHDRHYHRGYDYDHDYDHNQPRRTTTMKAKKRSRPTSNTGGARGNGGGGSDGNLPAAAAPVRINVENTTLSVRKQLSLVRRFQEQQQLGDTPKRNKPLQRTSFRRQKDDEQQRRRRKRNAEVRDTDIPDGKYETDVEPIMFVDGYNVIGRWPRLRKWRDRDDLEHARRLLLDDVAEFSAVRGWECVVVFDAGGSGKLLILVPHLFHVEKYSSPQSFSTMRRHGSKLRVAQQFCAIFLFTRKLTHFPLIGS